MVVVVAKPAEGCSIAPYRTDVIVHLEPGVEHGDICLLLAGIIKRGRSEATRNAEKRACNLIWSLVERNGPSVSFSSAWLESPFLPLREDIIIPLSKSAAERKTSVKTLIRGRFRPRARARAKSTFHRMSINGHRTISSPRSISAQNEGG